MNCDGKTFLFEGNRIYKVDTKIEGVGMDELDSCISNQKQKENVEIDSKVFDLIRKKYGNFEILI